MVVTQAPQSFIMLTTGKRGSGVWEGSVLSLHFIFKSKAKRSSPPFPPSASEGGHAARGCSRKTPCGGRLLSPRRQEDGSATLGERQVPGRPAPPSPARPGPARPRSPAQANRPPPALRAPHTPPRRGAPIAESPHAGATPDASGQRPASSLPLRPCPSARKGLGESVAGRCLGPPRAARPHCSNPAGAAGCRLGLQTARVCQARGPWGPAPLQSNGLEHRGPHPVAVDGAASGSGEWRVLRPRLRSKGVGGTPGLQKGLGPPDEAGGPWKGLGSPEGPQRPPERPRSPPRAFFI